MVFADVLDRVDRRRRRLVFYNVEDHERTEPIIDYVGVHDVIIEYATDERVPPSSTAVRRGNETLVVDDIESVATYITAWEAGLASDHEQPALFATLDETVFGSSNKRQLVLASRVIETRAVTIGHGDYWWVIFDGTDHAGHHAALIAKEDSPGEYTGFWIYRQSVVDELRGVVDSLGARRVTPRGRPGSQSDT